MDWEMRDLMCSIELIKEKINDVITSFAWYDDEYFRYNANHVLTKEEVISHGEKYHEHRIKNLQTIDLMVMYLKEIDGLIEKFHEIEKASSSADQSQDNA